MTLIDQIKAPKARVFRRLSIKRRDSSSGLFEDNWLDISDDVKRWGTLTYSTGISRQEKFKFSGASIQLENDSGKYNPEENDNSLWRGYASQQRTLVRIEAGFLSQTLGANGIWTNNELPTSQWDVDFWDVDEWDGDSTLFIGLISGDIPISSNNTVTINVKPLNQIFYDYPARNLTGFTSTGMTASEFIGIIRDQTDSLGNYIFRPFFGDTTANWLITGTSITYASLNTSTAEGLIDKTVWDVITQLAEAEQFEARITRDGKFKFGPGSVTAAAVFQFYGTNAFSSQYGHTIKSIDRYGTKVSDYYSRVQLKWVDSNTVTSYAVEEATLQVNGANNPWNLGVRTFSLENFWVNSSTTANSIVSNIFNQVSSLKREIVFKSSFNTIVDASDKIILNNDPDPAPSTSRWDQSFWASATTNELIWDSSGGDALYFLDKEFKALSVSINLDALETMITAKEV